jgi:hypothetical protein
MGEEALAEPMWAAKRELTREKTEAGRREVAERAKPVRSRSRRVIDVMR